MVNNIVVHTGEIVQISGIYKASGGKDYTFVEGKTVPPNREGVRQKFTLVKKTPHERK